jgi:SAM-dependent methyltransferase
MGQLPEDFLARTASLEDSYLQSEDPIRQSGGLLDIGCANGYLAGCLVDWAAERGVRLTPHGIDIGARLIAEAKRRLPAFADNFQVANGWDWQPGRRFGYVYTLSDCVPPDMLAEYVGRLLERLVEPGGRLVVGSYGSRSRSTPPLPIGDMLAAYGHHVAGRSWGGDPPVTAFAWVVRQGGSV